MWDTHTIYLYQKIIYNYFNDSNIKLLQKLFFKNYFLSLSFIFLKFNGSNLNHYTCMWVRYFYQDVISN